MWLLFEESREQKREWLVSRMSEGRKVRLLKAIIAITIVSIIAVCLLQSAVVGAFGKSYKAVIKVNFVDSCWDSLYARISDSKANEKTGEHDTLVGKFTVENPKHTLLSVEKSFKFDPKKVPSGFSKEIIRIMYLESDLFHAQSMLLRV
jgi:hypothetical protein